MSLGESVWITIVSIYNAFGFDPQGNTKDPKACEIVMAAATWTEILYDVRA